MSRYPYGRSGQYKWKKNGDDDRYPDGSGDYLHLRDRRGGRHSGSRKSLPSGGSAMIIKRALSMNLLPTSGGNNSSTFVNAQHSGLGPGEVWIRITIVYGGNYEMTDLQELVNRAIGTQIRFYNCLTEGRNAVMFAKIRQKDVNNYRKCLQSLRDPVENKSLISDMTTVSEPRVPGVSNTPAVNNTDAQNQHVFNSGLPDHWIEALRNCFVQRFQANTRSLDLSSLHTEPTLLSQGLYLPLNRQSVVYALVNILKENQAQLASVNLSSNRLTHLNAFSSLASTAPGFTPVTIERIDLSENPLNGLHALVGLRYVSGLVELDISETPLMSRNQTSDRFLITKLQKLLPSLKRLNGRDLPQSINFAIEQESGSISGSNSLPNPLPSSILGYFPNDDIKLSLLRFLKQYFTRYDSQPRGENMLSYYTSVSQLVLSVAPELRQVHASSATARIDTPNTSGGMTKTYLMSGRVPQIYIQRSRNLLRCADEQKRRDTICRGSLAISSLLGELPATEHPLESLSVDVAFHSPTQLLFTVSGVFYEISPIIVHGDDANSSVNNSNSTNKTMRKVLRCFSRTMILVAPEGHIIQDDFIISNPSLILCKKYITEVATRAKTQTSEPPSDPVPTSPPTIVEPDITTQENLAQQFSQRTGMNISFSRQCLQEYRWDVNAAWSAFETMNNAGKIPAIAFTS